MSLTTQRPMLAASCCDGLSQVLSVRTRAKMVRVDAERLVALVQQIQIIRKWAAEDLPDSPVSGHSLTVQR